MSLILLGAGKGAPGVTTAAVALAAVWPRRGVVAECDPSGADLALRLVNQEGRPLAQDRGMLSLATAVGSNQAELALSDHVQTAAGGLDVLVGPPSPRHAAALLPLWPALGVQLAGAVDCDVLADCGRLTPPTVVQHLVSSARLLVLLARATPAGMAHLRPILTDLDQRGLSEKIVVLPIGEDRRRVRGEVNDIVRQLCGPTPPAVVGPLAADPSGAAGLAGEWTRHLDRTPLVASARRVAHELDVRLAAELTVAR